jgi:uncharacterized repeat protein (TIGR01451 family)
LSQAKEDKVVMDGKRKRPAYQLVGIGLLLALMLALLAAWGVAADDPPPGANGALVLYEVRLTEAGIDRLQVAVPPDFEYVGLAASSQVGVEPEVVMDGEWLAWNGPFSAAEVLRFWLAPISPTAAPDNLPIAGIGVQAVRVEPVAPAPTQREVKAPSAILTATFTATKTVTPTIVWPQDDLWVTYNVTFTSDATQTTMLDRITDTLPAGFLFGGMAWGSDVITPPLDVGDSKFVWESIAFSGTLEMRYHVQAVEEMGEYYNSVVAVAGGEQIGPASVGLSVAQASVAVDKQATESQVVTGSLVDYQVSIQNTGSLTDTLQAITDTLPAGFSFVEMLPGDITDEPIVNGLVLTWTPALDLGPGELATLIYRVRTGGVGIRANNVIAKLALAGPSDPDSSSVQVDQARTHLPQVLRWVGPVGYPLPWEDDFATGLSPGWQPFVNWPDLDAKRWWASGGVYNYACDKVLPEYTSYDLSMFNADGTQAWTDYRIETRFKDVKDHNLKQAMTGLWFRGTYQDSGLMDGGIVGGYYLYMRPSNDTLYLTRIRASESKFRQMETVASHLYANRIGRKHWYDVIVEVRGANIQIWFGDEVDGMVKAFDWTDPYNTWPQGTVGFATYYTASRFDYIRVLPLN